MFTRAWGRFVPKSIKGLLEESDGYIRVRRQKGRKGVRVSRPEEIFRARQ